MILLSPQEFLLDSFPRRAAELEQLGLLDEFEELMLEYIVRRRATKGLKMKDTNARQVVRYFKIYKQFLRENNLDDDSKEISVESLINFVENHISEDDRMEIITDLIDGMEW
jgi:hypothetical protein